MRKRIYRDLLLTALVVLVLAFGLVSLAFWIGANSLAEGGGLWLPLLLASTTTALLALPFCWWLAGRLTQTIVKPLAAVVDDLSTMAAAKTPGMMSGTDRRQRQATGTAANLGSESRSPKSQAIEIYDELLPWVQCTQAQMTQMATQIAQAQKDQALLAILTEGMNEGLLLIDGEQRVRAINYSAQRILETSSEIVGKNVLEAHRNLKFLEHVWLAISGQPSELGCEIAARTYQVRFSPVERGALVLLLDITERAESERLRREFSANVSHELKTPLTVISGYTELISTGLAKEGDLLGMVEKIGHESSRLISLIDDIIRLSELDEAERTRQFSQFDLAAVIQEAADGLQQQATAAQVTLYLPTRPQPLLADRDMLFELCYNLIDNAIKYNRPGGSIEVQLSSEQGQTQMTVRDTGIGIEPRHLDRIFERFYRVDPSRSKQRGGTGLGLSIVKHIVNFHNGSVRVESQPGVGTTVRVVL
ncbi:MAG: ATP-binding protein [Actinomycetia bacterium]|nr:ATP-binding protein [Actinomycetes bacterium]